MVATRLIGSAEKGWQARRNPLLHIISDVSISKSSLLCLRPKLLNILPCLKSFSTLSETSAKNVQQESHASACLLGLLFATTAILRICLRQFYVFAARI